MTMPKFNLDDFVCRRISPAKSVSGKRCSPCPSGSPAAATSCEFTQTRPTGSRRRSSNSRTTARLCRGADRSAWAVGRARAHGAVHRHQSPERRVPVPVRLPGPDGRHDDWNRSALEGAQLAMERWVRVASNRLLGAYEIFEATAALSDPDWPTESFEKILEVAFKDHYIDSVDHPAVRRLRGEI